MMGADNPEFGDWYEGLKRLGVKAMRRPFAIVPAEFNYVFEGSDLLVSFGLPTGTYATSLLRELVVYEQLDNPGDVAFGK